MVFIVKSSAKVQKQNIGHKSLYLSANPAVLPLLGPRWREFSDVRWTLRSFRWTNLIGIHAMRCAQTTYGKRGDSTILGKQSRLSTT